MELKQHLQAQLLTLAVIGGLGGLSLGLWRMHDAVGEELTAAQQHVQLIQAVAALAAAPPHGPQATEAGRQVDALAGLDGRHIVAQWHTPDPLGAGVDPVSPALRLLHRWMGGAVDRAPVWHAVPLGERTLWLRVEPAAELREALADSGALLGALALWMVAMLVAAGRLLDRCMAPARQLSAALASLAADGQSDSPALAPGAAWASEFRLIAGALADLRGRLAQAQASQHRLQVQLLAVQDRERAQLARDLHDDMGQQLTAMSAVCAWLARSGPRLAPGAVLAAAEQLRESVQAVSLQLRGVLQRMRPVATDRLGLLQALDELLAHWRVRAPGLHIEARLATQLPRLSPEALSALHRGLQEAMSNVLRHSSATHVEVTLQVEAAGVRLRVQDSGPARPTPPPGLASLGLGLVGMQERARLAGGQLRQGPGAHGGWLIDLQVPAEPDTPRPETRWAPDRADPWMERTHDPRLAA